MFDCLLHPNVHAQWNTQWNTLSMFEVSSLHERLLTNCGAKIIRYVHVRRKVGLNFYHFLLLSSSIWRSHKIKSGRFITKCFIDIQLILKWSQLSTNHHHRILNSKWEIQVQYFMKKKFRIKVITVITWQTCR